MNHTTKMMKNLVMHSVSNDADKAKNEWVFVHVVVGSNVCMVCGHKVKTEVWLKNKLNGNNLCVGSVCAETLLSSQETGVMLDAVEMATKKAKRLRKAMKDAKEMDEMGVKSGRQKMVNNVWVNVTNVEWVEHLVSVGKL